MKIHEFQGRELLRTFGIPVPPSRTIETVEQAAGAFKAATGDMGTRPRAVIKAQVHAGGRGKAGFVKLVSSVEEAQAAARFMFTNRMKSPQTPPEGLEVRRLLVAAAVEIEKEFYLAITTDRATRRNVLIASREGGVEIEEVAKTNPGAILRAALHPLLGLQAFQARRVAYGLGLTGPMASQAATLMYNLSRLFVAKDCTLAEINPLVIARTPAGDRLLLAIDAKFNFDDNAIFRHKDIEAMFDPSEENPAEMRARTFGLSYIALKGSIGCLVNGAGLAMATMDAIKLHGGARGIEPANFLDVGGSANEEAVTEAFSIILGDPSVRGVLVNIFGGIMRCDVIAQGIVNAATKHRNPDGSTGFNVPLVVRLEGTNVEAGRAILAGARTKLPTLQPAVDLADAAARVCAAVA